ncbi:MAG: hypothetical protein ACJAXW_004160 [Candidatus Azotimanducaceae bacterium]|jgi:hypothetical protein
MLSSNKKLDPSDDKPKEFRQKNRDESGFYVAEAGHQIANVAVARR